MTDVAANAATHTPAVYRGTTAGGYAWTVELTSGEISVGATMRGRIFIEGEGLGASSNGSVALTAHGSQSSTTLDTGSIVSGLIPGSSDDGDDDFIPTKTRTTASDLVAISAPLEISPQADAAVVTGTFELEIPIDAPPRVRVQDLTVTWSLDVTFELTAGSQTISIGDLPVTLGAEFIAATPHLASGAMDTLAGGTREGIEWSIEVQPLPLHAGAPFEGTLTIPATGPLANRRADVKIEARVYTGVTTVGRMAWIATGRVTGDDFGDDGRRRISFQGQIPADAFVTTAVGSTRLIATVSVYLLRWRLFGPEFKRPIAIASPPAA